MLASGFSPRGFLAFWGELVLASLPALEILNQFQLPLTQSTLESVFYLLKSELQHSVGSWFNKFQDVQSQSVKIHLKLLTERSTAASGVVSTKLISALLESNWGRGLATLMLTLYH